MLGRLSTHQDFSAALTFPDSDAVAALESIVRHRPRLIALERPFATTARGAALIDRIRTDPALTTCEIRIVTHDASTGAAPLLESPPPVAARDIDSGVLDAHGTRVAPRFAMREGLEVTLDGRPARLLDLSVGGAQLVTPLTLRPNQRVRLALPGAERPIRCSASIQWATFELPPHGPRYRAGLRFLDANVDAVTQFITAHKA